MQYSPDRHRPGCGYMTGPRILRKIKPLKPFVPRPELLDIASVLLKHPGEKMGDFKICQELHGDHQPGWEINTITVMAGAHYLKKYGYISGDIFGYCSNEKTLSLFDLTPVPG